VRCDAMPPICLTRRDFAQLDSLLATYARTHPCRAADILRTELARATIVEVDDIAPNVVRMHSQVRIRDEHNGSERVLTLVYPAERGSSSDALSILTSLGAALIGLAEGQSITFTGPDGRTRRVLVVKVLRRARVSRGAGSSVSDQAGYSTSSEVA
jgi:regulator of nucleoside diphosphate kinase